VQASAQATVVPVRPVASDTQHCCVLVHVAVPQAVAVISGSVWAGPASSAGVPPRGSPVVPGPVAPPPLVAALSPVVAVVSPLVAVVDPEVPTIVGPMLPLPAPVFAPSSPLDPVTSDA
jgi:hypothetical protein